MSDDLQNLDDKLKAFRAQEQAGKAASDSAARDAENMSAGVRAGMELVVSIVGGGGLGWVLDRWLGTLPLFLIIFLLAGIGAGFFNVWRITQGIGSTVGFAALHRTEKDAKRATEKDG